MMKILLGIALTAFCWGIYGPVLHKGQVHMGGSLLRPFVCVGVAYFLIAVLVPFLYLYFKKEQGSWSVTGTLWSLAAGAAGAIGALGLIFAFYFKGNPAFVMPLVFGGAPVVNSFLTIFMARNMRQIGPVFLAGLILVVCGAVTVLVFRPTAAHMRTNWADLPWVIASVAVVILGWGVYGPVLHKGQMLMGGSRLRPFICVGLAYFLIAVLVPLIALTGLETDAAFTFTGSLWSLAAGAAGAIGALGIILAFAFGGKPIYAMPLVFGCAPVINTFTTMIATGSTGAAGPLFYAGLILVAVGAVVVLVFAPKKH